MCGISGIFSNYKSPDVAASYRMAARLAHRGPDHTGFYSDDLAVLAHNRLSVIDLSSQAHQPMVSECGRYVIVYNGEVYNYRELARRYALPTATRSDTEVVLRLFALKGKAALPELNGMFAFAVLDRERNKITLCRDRLGVKPLYYFQNQEFFAFASEMKAMLEIPAIRESAALNRDALAEYFHLGFIPAPATIYANIHKLRPGHVLEVMPGGMSDAAWWTPDDHYEPRPLADRQAALEQLDTLVNDAVRMRLVSDVPLGCLLSGGVDSSLVSAVAARHAQGGVDTFCVKFDNRAYDESDWARKVAERIGSRHHQTTVTSREAIEMLPAMVAHYDEPYGDTSAIPTMLVSKLASRRVTVTLSGDGGDELFHGYGAHLWAERLRRPWIRGTKDLLGMICGVGNARMQRVSRLFDSAPCPTPHIYSQEQYCFAHDELRFLLRDDPAPWMPPAPRPARALRPAEIQAAHDIRYYLPDDLLVKVDRASMYYGVENRVPLLDYRLAEWSLALAPELKIKDGAGKYLLKELLFKYLPRELFDRPKQGFAVPLPEWMRGDLKPLFMDHLSPDALAKYGLVDARFVQDLSRRFYKGDIGFYYRRLWLVAGLQMWLDQSIFKK